MPDKHIITKDGKWVTVSDDELYHYGVKGQKWGVRRYQNKDGTLTSAGKKRLAKELKKDYENNSGRLSEESKRKLSDTIERSVTTDDKRRLFAARRKWEADADKSEKAEDQLYEIGSKYIKDEYDRITRENPDTYTSVRDQGKLREYLYYDYGRNKAAAERPDLAKISDDAEASFKDYMKECRYITDKVVGKYGDVKLRRNGQHIANVEYLVDSAIYKMGR